MTDTDEIEKSLGEHLADLVQRKPHHYDVTFSVGPEKIKVKAVQIILKAVSPVFEKEFEEKWESSVVKEGDGIPLPDVNPDAFELFVKLIISDTWPVDALNSLNLEPSTLLNLHRLCRRFEITKGIKNLGSAAEDFILNLTAFKDTHEFLELSQNNLETIISHERVPLDEKEIFESACRWAENQCQQKKMEPTGENIRQVLGSCFFEIRFPTMKFETFSKVSLSKKNLFSPEERCEIYDFIALDEKEKACYDRSQLQFKPIARYLTNSFGCSVLRLPKQFKITASPSFKCDGKITWSYFQVNKKISLHGVGFLGPIDGDTHYDVSFQFIRIVNGSYTFDTGRLKKDIFAPKGKIFHFLFDEPITIQPNSYDSSWSNKCYVEYSFKIHSAEPSGCKGMFDFIKPKGTSNTSQHKVENPKQESVLISGVEFTFDYTWNNGRPLAELLYKSN